MTETERLQARIAQLKALLAALEQSLNACWPARQPIKSTQKETLQ
jgi:hypothetical protein